MTRRCKHPSWTVPAVDYAEPTHNLSSARGADADLMLALLYGLSTVTQRCTVCNWVSAENKPGRVLLPDPAEVNA